MDHLAWGKYEGNRPLLLGAAEIEEALRIAGHADRQLLFAEIKRREMKRALLARVKQQRRRVAK